jgi:chitinase
MYGAALRSRGGPPRARPGSGTLAAMRTAAILALALAGCLEPDTAIDVVADDESALVAAVYELGSRGGASTCLDVAGAGTADGTRIQQWTCNQTAAQRFRVEDLGAGLARLVAPASGKCVDVQGAGTSDGTAIHLWTCNGTSAQVFRIDDLGGGDVRLVNPGSGRCVDVDAASPDSGARVQIWECNGTVAQRWRPRRIDDAPPTGGLPAKIVAGYYPNWTPSPIRIRDIPAAYNVVYLFAAHPVGGSPGHGTVEWSAPGDGRGAANNLVADLRHARTVQGRRIILSVGGAGNGMAFPDRATSQRLVDSVAALHARLGGFDGLDWNTFEADQAPDTDEMIWMSLELKRRFPGFAITAPPAPWNARDKAFCAAMAGAGALDYCAPQYYDGPGLDQQAYIATSVREWVGLLGASKVVVGFGIWDQPNYMAIGEAIPTWSQVESAHPALRGAFDWNIHLDESQGWPFASQLAPLVP